MAYRKRYPKKLKTSRQQNSEDSVSEEKKPSFDVDLTENLKIAILYYGAVICATETFNVSNFRKLLFPIAIVLLISSMTVATNFAEHIKEGLKFVPLYFHVPMQIVIPGLLLIVGFFRKKRASANG